MKRILMLLLGLLPGPHPPAQVNVQLSEWQVALSQQTVAAGPVTFVVTNSGQIPHAIEVEGQGLEKEIETIQPGAIATFTLTLKPGRYEVYCPVGDGSHKKLGMDARLAVTGGNGTSTDSGNAAPSAAAPPVQAINVTSGGAVIQILPGPFPFPDSAAPILRAFGDEREGLESQVKNGPYSNNVAPISGSFSFTAWDKGPTRDSVNGTAEFRTQDGAQCGHASPRLTRAS